jgi:hypothetical protein
LYATATFQYGGNICVENGFVTRCEIYGGAPRDLGGFGGGVYIRDTGVADTCFIHDNTAGLGGGVTLPAESTGAVVINCTITKNVATSAFGLYGGGLAVNGQGVVRNNIIWGNTGNGGSTDNVVLVLVADPFSDFRNNNYPSVQMFPGAVTLGPDNITSDPQLMESGRVPLTSPCFQAGFLARTAVDLDNAPRASTATPTMGAFVAV